MATYQDLLKAVQELKDKANEYAPDSLERTTLFDPSIEEVEEFIKQANKAGKSALSGPFIQAAFESVIGSIKFLLKNIDNDEIDDDSWLS